MDKEIKIVVNAAKKRGWKLLTGRRHFVLKHPSGRLLAVSMSPSDRHAYKVLARAIRRAEDEIKEKETSDALVR